MFKSLLKAVTVVVDVPVAVITDFVTMGGVLNDKTTESTHTSDALGRFVKNIEDAANPDKE